MGLDQGLIIGMKLNTSINFIIYLYMYIHMYMYMCWIEVLQCLCALHIGNTVPEISW